MSPRKKTGESAKEAPRKPHKTTAVRKRRRPAGAEKKTAAARPKPAPPKAPPQAQVLTRTLGKIRQGKGFSLPELREVGLDLKSGRKRGLKTDLRRRSRHKENVEALRAWLKPPSRKRKSGKRAAATPPS